MNAPETVAPDRIANHLIVGAAEQRSSAAFAISAQSASSPGRISGWATRSPRAAAPSPPGLMQMMALALADACTRVSRERLNELAARTRLHTPHLTPPKQESAWTNLVQEVCPGVPILLCTVKAQRQ